MDVMEDILRQDATVDVLHRLSDEQGVLEARLSKVFGDLLIKLSNERALALKEEQDTWLKFRQARAHSIALESGGSLAGIMASSAVIDMTKDRISQLDYYAQGLII